MSRWICVDDIAVEIGGGYIDIDAESFMSAPSIDIVRCGECKWFDSRKNDSEIWSMCTRHFGKYIDVNADDFCSYGEKENNGNQKI